MSLMDTMNQRAMELGVPFAVHFDVTYRCNERCVHCYLDHDDHGEMTTGEMLDVIGQLAEAGGLFLTPSGGQVPIPTDFFAILGPPRPLPVRVKIKDHPFLNRREPPEPP